MILLFAFFLSLLGFTLIYFGEGDLATLSSTIILSEADKAAINMRAGLHESFFAQFFRFLRGFLMGDSISLKSEINVFYLIKTHLPYSLGLNLTCFIAVVLCSITLSLFSVKLDFIEKNGREFSERISKDLPAHGAILDTWGAREEELRFKFDRSFAAVKPLFSFVHFVERILLIFSPSLPSLLLGFVFIPSFVLSILFILIFAIIFPIFPGSLANDILRPSIAEFFRHLVLPFSVLFLSNFGISFKIVKDAFSNSLKEAWVESFIIYGVSKRRIKMLAMYSSLSLVLPYFSSIVGGFIIGAVVVESIFSYPGVGKLLMDALLVKDYTVGLSVLIFYSVFLVGVNALSSYFVSNFLK